MGPYEILAGLGFGPPVLCLAMAWSAARDGRLARAESLATFAGTWSWLVMAAGGVLGAFALAGSFPLWRHPLYTVPIAASIALWWYTRSFYASIRARREAEARSPPPEDGPG